MFNHYLKINRIGSLFGMSILLLFSLSIKGITNSRESNSPIIDFQSFPKNLGSWVGEDSMEMDSRSLDVLQLTSYIRRVYKHPSGRSIYLYIGYWDKQSGEHQAAKHSPALCLPSNGWLTTHLNSETLDSSSYKIHAPIEARRIIGELRSKKELFYYWFFAGQDYYSSEWYALIKLSLENILYGRSDGGIVEISTSLQAEGNSNESSKNSEETIQLFLQDLVPYLDKKIIAGQSINNEPLTMP